MFQVIDNKIYYIVEFKMIPTSPISDGGDPALTPYSEALTQAIRDGQITKPGKYAISVNHARNRYDIFEVQE